MLISAPERIKHEGQVWWLKHILLTMQEAEIVRITVRGQLEPKKKKKKKKPGIKLTKNVNELYNEDCKPLKKEIEKDYRR
jgi:hypothetical protein